MIPSNKTPEMERVLSRSFGFDRKERIESNRCCPAPIGCGGEAIEFRDEISRKEYSISGLCQNCQDSIFGVD